MATILPLPITSSSIPSPLSSSSQSLRHRSLQTLCCTNSTNGAQFPMPPLNPNFGNAKDSSLPNLALAAGTSPSATRPLPGPMNTVSAPSEVDTYSEDEVGRKKPAAPDIASEFLDDRILYICLPFVSDVTELIVAQIMYLDQKRPDEPIKIYIDSTGAENEDGELVARETEGFAIYDALMQLKCEIHTMGVGEAIGPACLLLAAGTKGKRYMFPNATAAFPEAMVPPMGLMKANYVSLISKEISLQKRIFAELMAKHTGQSVETIERDMRTRRQFNGEEAVKYGIIDKVLTPGKKSKKKTGSLRKRSRRNRMIDLLS